MTQPTAVDASPPASTARSIERSLEILAVLRDSRVPLRLSEIARATGNHLATTQRIVNVLLRFGYVEQEGGGYSVGITSLMNAYTYLLSNSLIQVAHPVAQELAATTGFAASLSVRVELKQILLLRVDGATPLRYRLPVGEPLPLHLGGARILAATLGPQELQRLLDELHEIRLATGEVVTHEQFIDSLRVIREQGHVYGYSQRYPGAASASVPVFNRDRQVIASLQLSGFAEEMDESKMVWCIDELKRASSSLEQRLP